MKKISRKVLLVILFLLICTGCNKNIKKYIGNTYSINYIYDGELLDFDINSYVCGDELTLPEISRPGFLGWYSNKELTGEKVIKINSSEYGNKIFYAMVDESLENYTIEYYLDDTKLEYSPSSYKYGDSFTLANAEYIEEKIFIGWFSDKEYKTEITEITSTDSGNKTFYAYYKNEYELYVDKRDYSDTVRLDAATKSVNNGDGITKGLPSTGDVKALVVPVEFSDYKAKSDMKENINKALFGSSVDTGWESLSSYYKKSSYGKLNITGFITDVYNTNKKSSYYERLGDDATYELLKEVLTYFDSTLNYKDFDSNDDGYIDAIYLIYTAPVDYEDDTIWWAYSDEYITDTSEYYDGIEADFYMFAGYDFLFETPECGEKLILNAETFIHETGHLLGLDDYYDYDTTDKNNKGGLGGGDMMDCNGGDHNAYSKSILGWITPTVLDLSDDYSKAKILLDSYESSGDALIITKSFNNTYFDEYYILSLYTPDGLNELEAGNSGLFSKTGITLYHVSAALSSKQIDCVWDITQNNNATGKIKLIKLIEADGKNDIDKEKFSTNNDLYVQGNVINNLKWNDGTNLDISIQIKTIKNNQVELLISR